MSATEHEIRRINWSECFAFTHLFRGFRMAALDHNKLILALVGILATLGIGYCLDALWIASGNGIQGDELGAYLRRGFESETRTSMLFESETRTSGGAPEALPGHDPSGIFAEWAGSVRIHVRGTLEAAYNGKLVGHFGMDFNVPPIGSPGIGAMDLGIAGCLIVCFKSGLWALSHHWLYAGLFGLLTLAIWSFFGGAICRIAALQFARGESLSLPGAIRFAADKFVELFTAPLVIVAVLLICGVALMLGGAVGGFPYTSAVIGLLLLVGCYFNVKRLRPHAFGAAPMQWLATGGAGLGGLVLIVGGALRQFPNLGISLMGLLFFLVLIVGFAIAFVLVAGFGSAGLFWPAIAAENSDSFNAFGPCYNYVVSHPWRTLFYGLVSLVYGALCWLLIRLLAFLTLGSAHWFLGGLLNPASLEKPGSDPAVAKLDRLWAAPEGIYRLWGGWRADLLHPGEWTGAILINFWVAIVILLTYAFLITFFFSSLTIIYFLLRHVTDGTDLEDVWVEKPNQGSPMPKAAESATPAAPSGEDPSLGSLAVLPIVQGPNAPPTGTAPG